MPTLTPSRVAGKIVDPVRNRLAALRNEEVMHSDGRGPAFRPPLSSGVLEVADQLFLLRIDRDDWLGGGLAPTDLLVDVAELGVPVRMLRPLPGLAVGLQAVPRGRQQFAHQLAADRMAHGLQRGGQLPYAL